MKKFTKVLSVALVVVMMFSMVVFNSSALADGKKFGLVLRADKKEAEIVPGAEVTVTFHFELADYSQLMSDMRLCVAYDKSVYTPDVTTRTFIGDMAGYANDATVARANDAFAKTCLTAAGATADELALYDGGVMIQIGADPNMATSKGGFLMTEGDDGISIGQISLKFTVTGDAAAIAAGSKNIIWPAVVASNSQYIKYTDGSSTPKQYATADADFALNNIMANMPAAPTPVVINPLKGQMRYANADKTEFDVRALAYIKGADFKDIFTADKATAEGMIKEVGFVFASGTNVPAGPSMDDVKALVENGTAITGYAKKQVYTISTSMQTGDYVIACTVTDIPEATVNSADGKLVAAAYIVYEVDGQTVYGYISDIQTIEFQKLYNSTNKPTA